MRFSQRTAWELEENFFTAKVRAAHRSGHSLYDLTPSNPTVCGFDYDPIALLAPLAHVDAAVYDPHPLGMASACRAVADYYREAGAEVGWRHICLTTSTSEAYSYLFRLLCDAGDEVLIASPSYPLFDYIAQLDHVKLQQYPLLYDPHHGWLIDLHALEAAITPRTRAIIVVHPNNPTGHFCSVAERAALEVLAVKHQLALIVDEVFLDYALPGKDTASFAVGSRSALTFVLSGISKVCGLPQMKCSWIAAAGPEGLVKPAMERLEVIADTFLSMNAPSQHALPHWLAARRRFQGQVRSRVVRNLAALDSALADSSCERLILDAGWTVVLRVPRNIHGVDFCEALLSAGVIVQPGSFYGLPDGRAVLSLITPQLVWGEGVSRLAALGRA